MTRPFVRASRDTRKMSPRDLSLFLRPVRLRDLPKGPTGYAPITWTYLALNAEGDGLIRSPGRSAHWHLTDHGVSVVADYLASTAA